MTEHGRHSLVVLADLTETAEEADVRYASLLDELDQLGRQTVGVVVAPRPEALRAPEGWTATDAFAPAAGQAFAAASARRAHLLVVRGTCRPTAAKLAELLRVLDDDPMIGCVHARLVTRDGRLLPALGGENGHASVSAAVLDALPSFSFVADHVSACMLMPHRLTGNLEPRLEGWRSLDGLLLEYAVRARRLGFRAVIANAALVALPVAAAGARTPAPEDLRRISDAYPATAAMVAALADQRDVVDERTVAAVYDAPDSLLIDVRNLNAVINGTTKAIIGLTSAWYASRPSLPTTLWVPAAAARFHGLADKYPGWQIVSGTPPHHYAAAIRLSQPWHVSELLSLHETAAVNAFLMLDTIAWDIGYTAPPGLDTVWQMAARTADGLIFISEFSRQRFLRRFPLGRGVRTAVVHLSLWPDDYLDDTREPVAGDNAFWLILGNAYDHKHVAPTVDTLARAFPTRELVVLGDRATPRGRRIRQLQSGSTSEPLLQGLYAAAGVVVFPSFYEGFGLPVLNALAYGRTVVARDSSLMRELAAAYTGPGQLVLFQDEVELVEQLTHLANGLPVETVPFAPPGTPAHGWTAAATALQAELTALVNRPPPSAVRELRSFVAALLRDGAFSSPR